MSHQASAVRVANVPPAHLSQPPVPPNSTLLPLVSSTASVSLALQAPTVQVAVHKTIVTQGTTARKNRRIRHLQMGKWVISARRITIARKAKERPGSAMMVSCSPRQASRTVMLVTMAIFAGMAARSSIAQRTTIVMETRPTLTENCVTMATMD